MAPVGAYDILDVVLIDTGNAVQKGTECRLVREKMDDIRLVRSGDLGIRDNEGGEKCVCPAAFTAAETADAQADKTVRGLQATLVIAMDRQTGGMSACTCELMELEGGKDVIINVLVQMVAGFDG